MLLKKWVILWSLPLLLVAAVAPQSRAQVNPQNSDMNSSMNLFQQADSSQADSSKKDLGWINANAVIYYTTLFSNQHRTLDTEILHFQHFEPKYPWWGVDLGNYGTAAHQLFFHPVNARPGLSSGYHVYDLYRFQLDSLRFYNTTNPYTDFSFVLGSKDQQIVDLLHTQNITPNWNFAANIKAGSSQGFFSGQTAKNIQGSVNTNYVSPNQRYRLKAAILYNRFAQDENGGILADSFLTLPNFNDRSRIPTVIPPLIQGQDKSSVNNILRDFDFFVQNNYSWGQTDTTYNKDSTDTKVVFTPRFRLQHVLHIHSEKHQYNDYLPDSLRYAAIAPLNFGPEDTLKGRQKWTQVENRFSISGFIGKHGHLLAAKAGIGNQIDHFSTSTSNGYKHDNSLNAFIFGKLGKTAKADTQWAYDANARLYVTGEALGDFALNVQLKKQLSDWVGFSLGFNQRLTNAPYSFEHLSSNFFDRTTDLNKMSTTTVHAGLTIPKVKLYVNGNYQMIYNYLYFNNELKAKQNKGLITLLQLSVSKRVHFGKFVLGNKIVYQYDRKNTILHVPALMVHEQLAFQSPVFHGALFISTGIGVKYTSPYFCDGYSPYLNQFFVQNAFKTKPYPLVDIFFNFRLHHFRAFVSLSQMQQVLWSNNIDVPGYPSENMFFHFGFSWILVN